MTLPFNLTIHIDAVSWTSADFYWKNSISKAITSIGLDSLYALSQFKIQLRLNKTNVIKSFYFNAV